jgi:regulatory protein
MIINRVVRKDDKNVAIYFDNDEKLILSEDTFYNSGLRKGDEVSEDRYFFFIEQNILHHIKQRALSFLSRRFHSEKELFLKLKAKSYDERLIKIVLNDLKSKSFLNDMSFAKLYIEEKLFGKKWGMNKIRTALFNRGISSAIVDELSREYNNKTNSYELADQLAEKKLIHLKKRINDNNLLYQKIVSFLISRGFDYEIAKEVCNNLIKMNGD